MLYIKNLKNQRGVGYMYNKPTNALFRHFISPFYCSYMFRRKHFIIRELVCSLLSYAKKCMQFFWWYMLKKPLYSLLIFNKTLKCR
jgi:hypothetical protein